MIIRVASIVTIAVIVLLASITISTTKKLELKSNKEMALSKNSIEQTSQNNSAINEYSYEFYIKEDKVTHSKPPSQKVTNKNQKVVHSYTHQPTQFDGTDSFSKIEAQLPGEILPGFEYIPESEQPIFEGSNEGKYISVIPNHKPLLVRKEGVVNVEIN